MAVIALHDLNLSVVLIFPCPHSTSAILASLNLLNHTHHTLAAFTTAFAIAFAKAIFYTPNKSLLLSPLASSFMAFHSLLECYLLRYFIDHHI